MALPYVGEPQGRAARGGAPGHPADPLPYLGKQRAFVDAHLDPYRRTTTRRRHSWLDGLRGVSRAFRSPNFNIRTGGQSRCHCESPIPSGPGRLSKDAGATWSTPRRTSAQGSALAGRPGPLVGRLRLRPPPDSAPELPGPTVPAATPVGSSETNGERGTIWPVTPGRWRRKRS